MNVEVSCVIFIVLEWRQLSQYCVNVSGSQHLITGSNEYQHSIDWRIKHNLSRGRTYSEVYITIEDKVTISKYNIT